MTNEEIEKADALYKEVYEHQIDEEAVAKICIYLDIPVCCHPTQYCVNGEVTEDYCMNTCRYRIPKE